MNPLLNRPRVTRWLAGLALLCLILVPQACSAESHTLGALYRGESDEDVNAIVLFHFDGQETRREDLPAPDDMDMFTELVVVNGWIVYKDYRDIRTAKLGETESRLIAEDVLTYELLGGRLFYADSDRDSTELRAYSFSTGETVTVAHLGRVTIVEMSVSPDEKRVAFVDRSMERSDRLSVVTIADGSVFNFPDSYRTGQARDEHNFPVGPIEWLDNERILTIRASLIGDDPPNIIHSSNFTTGRSTGLIELDEVDPKRIGHEQHHTSLNFLRTGDEVYLSAVQSRHGRRNDLYRIDIENKELVLVDQSKNLRGGFNIRAEEIRTESGERPKFGPDSVPALYYNDQRISVQWPPTPFPLIPKVCPDDHCIVWYVLDLSVESTLSYFRPGMEEPDVLLKGGVTGFEWLHPDDVAHLQK
jgi:hypothetical protein